MKRIVYAVLLSLLFGCFCNNINAQTLTRYAKQRNQELAERQRMEQSNYEKACKEGTLAALNEYLSMYPKGKYIQDVKSRISEIEKKNEKDMYDYACRVETLQAYDAYLKKYPRGRYAQEARGRVEDMELWKRAKSDNTIAAYRNYLNTSKNKSYAQPANDLITDLESKEAWSLIRNSSSKSSIDSFVRKYPKSSCLTEAQKKLDELIAVEFYEQGNLQSAFDKFESAGGQYSIDSSNRSKYDECAEYVEYRKLNTYSKESDLIAFLKKYPSSRYYNQISNLVAISKAKSLSMYSNTYQFDDAISYAKDKSTKHAVKGYINQAKDAYRKYEHRRKARARKEWWKNNFKIGIDADYGTNMDSDSGADMFYSVGLVGRFGSYRQKVNFVTGVKYRWLRVMPKYGSPYDTGSTEWRLFGGAVCIPLYLRYNFAEVLDRSRVYLGFGGEYGFISAEKDVKEVLDGSYLSVFPQLGITSPNFELSCYIKSYLVGPFKKQAKNNSGEFECSCLLGVQMTVYF